MSQYGRHSEQAVKFMADFKKLKQLMDGDEPSALINFAKLDGDLNRLCFELYFSAEYWLKPKIEKILMPVDQAFTFEWRQYLEEWHTPVGDVFLADLLLESSTEYSGNGQSRPENNHRERLRSDWEAAHSRAKGVVSAISTAIEQIAYEASEDNCRTFEQDFIDYMAEAQEEWDRLVPGYGIDLERMIRRRTLLPDVLVPQHVVDRSKGEPLEILTSAQQAFVVGADQAALPMMRALIETLVELYPRGRSSGGAATLPDKIKSTAQLPRSLSYGAANEVSLNHIVDMANKILHECEEDISMRRRSEMEREIEMQRLFLILRNLIERVPAKS